MTSTMLSLVAVLALLLSGCSSGRPSAARALGHLVLSTVGEPGFTERRSATGPMPLDVASRATTVDPAVLRRYLAGHGYTGGFSRVLTRGDEFVTLLAYELDDGAAAEGLVELVFERLTTSVAFQPFDDPGVPGSRGFTLTSQVQGAVRFCVGEWFARRSRAFAVTRCAPFVLSVPAVTAIAQAQHARAAEGASG